MPTDYFYAPDLRTGAQILSKFQRVNGAPMGFAGSGAKRVFSDGADIERFGMLTMNADDPPMFKLMHLRPQSACSHTGQAHVCVVPDDRYDAWPNAPAEASLPVIRQRPAAPPDMASARKPETQLSLLVWSGANSSRLRNSSHIPTGAVTTAR